MYKVTAYHDSEIDNLVRLVDDIDCRLGIITNKLDKPEAICDQVKEISIDLNNIRFTLGINK